MPATSAGSSWASTGRSGSTLRPPEARGHVGRGRLLRGDYFLPPWSGWWPGGTRPGTCVVGTGAAGVVLATGFVFFGAFGVCFVCPFALPWDGGGFGTGFGEGFGTGFGAGFEGCDGAGVWAAPTLA